MKAQAKLQTSQAADTHTHSDRLRRVYVWELPVRLYHGINALSITVLIVTGLYIGNPIALNSSKEATFSYIMGTVRFVHFLAAYAFLFNFIFRIYWGFAGNKYAKWRNFIPTNKKFITDLFEVIKVDVLMIKRETNFHIGHNPMAGASYFMMFIAFAVQCVTGFGLYQGQSTWWLPKLFAWVPGLFGNDMLLRQVHHWATWFFVLLIVIHIYLVLYHDYIEGRGEISSMGGGWKFIEEDVFKKQEEEKKPE